MILVWLSPGLPASRSELADALPPEFSVLDAGGVSGGADGGFSEPAITYGADEISELPVGSLCVATVFETDLLARLAHRPAGVRLLVIGPDGALNLPPLPAGGTPPDHIAAAASVGDVAAAVRTVASEGAGYGHTGPLPLAAYGISPSEPGARRPRWRSRKLAGAVAVMTGLAIGGVLIAATEGPSTAGTNRTASGPANLAAPNGNQLPGAGGQGQDPLNGNGNQVPSYGNLGNGRPPGDDGEDGDDDFGHDGDGRFGAVRGQLQACLQQQGVTITRGQLRQGLTDAKVRAAFQKCLQSLGTDGSFRQLPARP